MYAPTNTTELTSLLTELIELLGEIQKDRNRPRAEAQTERLDALQAKAHAIGAPAKTLVAIQGARVLMELAELPPLRRDWPPSASVQ
jgi:hypothetical protein